MVRWRKADDSCPLALLAGKKGLTFPALTPGFLNPEPCRLARMTNTERKLIVQAQTRHGRRKHGVFLAEGLRCCREGLTRRAEYLRLALCTREFAESAEGAGLTALLHAAGQAADVLPEHEFAEFAATENPQGILCLFREFPAVPPPVQRADPFVLILDRVADPGNLGTILRTAWAVGLTECWLTEGTTDPFGPKAIRAGMGAQFALAVPSLSGLTEVQAELRRLGCPRMWCSMPRGGVDCFSTVFELGGNGLVIGNEAAGIQGVPSPDTVTIPMPGQAESLNAAQAATILLFEAVRRGLTGSRQVEPEGAG